MIVTTLAIAIVIAIARIDLNSVCNANHSPPPNQIRHNRNTTSAIIPICVGSIDSETSGNEFSRLMIYGLDANLLRVLSMYVWSTCRKHCVFFFFRSFVRGVCFFLAGCLVAGAFRGFRV